MPRKALQIATGNGASIDDDGSDNSEEKAPLIATSSTVRQDDGADGKWDGCTRVLHAAWHYTVVAPASFVVALLFSPYYAATGITSHQTADATDSRGGPQSLLFHPGEGYEPVQPAVVVAATTAPSPPRKTLDHSPIFTVHELQRRINEIAPFLPISVSVYACPGNDLTAASCAEVQVVLSGPLRRPAAFCSDRPSRTFDESIAVWDTAPSLINVEEFILEDSDSASIAVTSVQLMDLNFTATKFDAFHHSSAPALSPSGPKGTSLHDGLHNVSFTNLSHDSAVSTIDEAAVEEEPFEICRARVISLYQNIVASVIDATRAARTLRLSFVRCSLTPLDLLEDLKLPSEKLEHLSFVQCPLADAHIAALLRRARQAENFFGSMRYLMLSGTLSPEAVVSLLRFLDEEVEYLALGEIVLPQSVAMVALGHSLAMRLPHLLVNGKPIQRQHSVER